MSKLDVSKVLNSYKNEVEQKQYRDINGNLNSVTTYTERAFLAQHKLLLKGSLGRGTFSKVKKAYDLNNFRHIAIKIIDCNKAPKHFKKFLPRELDNWPKIKHQNIITMFYYLLNMNSVYIVLEYASGGDMLSYLQRINGPVPEEKIMIWMKQICIAVKYLHLKQVIFYNRNPYEFN